MEVSILREIGLTEREIKVYVALLELGKTTAGPISSRARLAHTKVYDTLQRLVEKGLVSYIVVSKTKYFQAEDPREIVNILDDRREKVIEVVKELQYKKKIGLEKQEVVMHEGYNAVRALFNRIISDLKKSDFYYVFALKESYKEGSAPLFFAKVHKKLEEKNILDYAIANESVKKEVLLAYSDNKNIQLRFVKQNIPVGVIIIKNKVIELIWGELPTAIEINSNQIYQHYKDFFEEVWRNAKGK
ncbi:MAG: helix-turn-helix domain-containing protein [Candidatus Nanoarchaeia archaeon]|nr:helix-turn-helix domain-containing protein [Candidatus Nanoarchaeia archaeon]